MRLSVKRNLLLIISAALGLAGCGRAVPDDVTVLTYASLYPPHHPFSAADIQWIEYIERESKGRLQIRPLWSGTLISSEQNLIEARHSVADIVMITPMYARNTSLQRIQSSFSTHPSDIRTQANHYHCLAEIFPVLNAELGPLTVLAVQGGNLPGLLTVDRPVRRLEDLRGLRLRTQRDMADVVRAFGADPVDMPMADVYSAMAKGVIDGVVAPADALSSMHLAEVGSYYTRLDLPRGAYPARAISQERIAQLPEDLRRLLLDSGAAWEGFIAEQVNHGLAQGFALARERGVTILLLGPADNTRLQALFRDNAMALARDLQREGVPAVEIIEGSRAITADNCNRT